MEVKISNSWRKYLSEEFDKEYFKKLVTFVKGEYENNTVYPLGKHIFRALNETSFEDVKVLILGQDPYHTPNVANGLAFSSNPGNPIPPSLRNIFKELKSDLGITPPITPDLTHWAQSGVLLLNATLTVRSGLAGSHQNKGWETFTDSVIKLLSDKKEHMVFILWGAYAQKKEMFIDSSKQLIIKSPHPSPFSADRGFFGSKPFSKANEFLTLHNIPVVEW